jgi:TolB-like protein/AraC-like DNA-binding protein/Tfp pilus assembly protein PilF
VNRTTLEHKLNELIEANLTNEQFGVEELASNLGYSRSHLHRKLQKENGKSISQYMREYRLERARQMMMNEDLNVSEAAYRVGFGSASYFSKSFTSYFGHAPSEIKEQLPEETKDNAPVSQNISPRRKRLGLIIPMLLTGLFLIIALSFVVRWYSGKGNISEDESLSIALLPFRSLSHIPENQYLCDGLGDAIARKLSSIEDLQIISRISTAHFVNEHTPLIQIAEELNTRFILEGSIQRHENQVRVEVGLVNGNTGVRLWSEHFDKDLEDIFDIENEISEHVAFSLSRELVPSPASLSNQGYTSNAGAYEYYLKGVFELRTYTRQGARKSEEYFKQAVELDPSFAMAYNWLGHSYIAQSAMFGADLDAMEGLEIAFPHIEKSVELDPNLKEARPIRAFYFLYHDWDFEKAEEEYINSLNTIQPESYALYADYLNFVRRHEEALEWSEKQEENEPYYLNTRKIMSLFYTGRIEEAISYAEDRLRIMKNYWTLDSYGFVLLNSGRYEQAIRTFLEIFEIENVRYPRILGWLGAAYARSGQQDKALEILTELEARHQISSAGSTGFFNAVVHSALGNTDEALGWLRVAIDDHEMEIPWLISEPQLFDLHEHPTFKALVGEVGFPV